MKGLLLTAVATTSACPSNPGVLRRGDLFYSLTLALTFVARSRTLSSFGRSGEVVADG